MQDHNKKWDAERIRTYKCGTHPKKGDLVMRRQVKTDSLASCYGIVTGKQKLPTGLVMPMILWCGRASPRRCISKNIELVVRNGNE